MVYRQSKLHVDSHQSNSRLLNTTIDTHVFRPHSQNCPAHNEFTSWQISHHASVTSLQPYFVYATMRSRCHNELSGRSYYCPYWCHIFFAIYHPICLVGAIVLLRPLFGAFCCWIYRVSGIKNHARPSRVWSRDLTEQSKPKATMTRWSCSVTINKEMTKKR